MKLKLLFLFLFFISIQAFSQDKKWSVEVNHSAIPSGRNDPIIELGLKYRFVDFGSTNFGLSLNGGYSGLFGIQRNSYLTNNTYFLQPRVFTEFNIFRSKKLRLHLGIGYSIENKNLSVPEGRTLEGSPYSSTNGGFNFNVGLSYDISERFFIQAQYDFINLQVRDEFVSQGETVKTDFNKKLHNIKIGVGYRF